MCSKQGDLELENHVSTCLETAENQVNQPVSVRPAAGPSDPY